MLTKLCNTRAQNAAEKNVEAELLMENNTALQIMNDCGQKWLVTPQKGFAPQKQTEQMAMKDYMVTDF